MSATRKVPQSGQLGQAGRQASTTLVGRHSTPLHPTLGCGAGRATRPAVMVAAAVAGSLCAATRECSRRRAPSAWRRAWTALSIPASGGACCCSVICWTSSAGSRVTGEWAASGPRAPTRCTSSGEQGLGLGRLWETLEQFGAFRCNCACLDCRAGLAFYCCTCACLDCRAAWRSIAAPVPAWIAERPGVLLLHLCVPGLQSRPATPGLRFARRVTRPAGRGGRARDALRGVPRAQPALLPAALVSRAGHRGVSAGGPVAVSARGAHCGRAPHSAVRSAQVAALFCPRGQ
jgi:hypothetical protein